MASDGSPSAPTGIAPRGSVPPVFKPCPPAMLSKSVPLVTVPRAVGGAGLRGGRPPPTGDLGLTSPRAVGGGGVRGLGLGVPLNPTGDPPRVLPPLATVTPPVLRGVKAPLNPTGDPIPAGACLLSLGGRPLGREVRGLSWGESRWRSVARLSVSRSPQGLVRLS